MFVVFVICGLILNNAFYAQICCVRGFYVQLVYYYEIALSVTVRILSKYIGQAFRGKNVTQPQSCICYTMLDAYLEIWEE